MGSCVSTKCCKDMNYQNITPIYQQKIKNDKKNYISTHSKHYERYFTREFKVSICSAKGERKKMEDDHSCLFTLPNHPNYSLFAIFDGHNGPKASQYLASNLCKTLNNISDLENNENIISTINKMDKEFISTADGTSGSTIVFAIISSKITSIVDLNRNSSTPRSKVCLPAIDHQELSKRSYGSKCYLPGFEMEYYGRVFWCGDSRCFSIKSLDINSINPPKFDVLTNDHNTKNKCEIERINEMNGTIIQGRVDGQLSVTRSFGDSKMKYDGSVVISDCQYTTFKARAGDSLLLCCDGLTERWSDKRLMKRLQANLSPLNQNENDTDAAKAIGNLVDDAINEGSKDNISVMFIQFKDGSKQKMNKKYENILI